MGNHSNYDSNDSCGFDRREWELAKAQAREILVHAAKHGDFVFYSDLASRLTAIDVVAHDTRFFELLGQISDKEHAEGRPLLSALVIQKDSKQPGVGYFRLAQARGRDSTDPVVAWAAEVKSIYSYLKGKRS